MQLVLASWLGPSDPPTAQPPSRPEWKTLDFGFISETNMWISGILYHVACISIPLLPDQGHNSLPTSSRVFISLQISCILEW